MADEPVDIIEPAANPWTPDQGRQLSGALRNIGMGFYALVEQSRKILAKYDFNCVEAGGHLTENDAMSVAEQEMMLNFCRMIVAYYEKGEPITGDARRMYGALLRNIGV